MTSKDSVKFSSTDHAHKILKNLNGLRQNSLFCDIKIVVGKNTFWAHKAVLSASSNYFQAMFTSGLSETEKSKIELHGVEDDIFSLLVDFMYTGQLEITNSNVQEIVIAADMFQLIEVIETCSVFLKKSLHVSNCIGIHHFAETHSCLNLQTTSSHFINQNFLQITREDEFLSLPLQETKKILASEHLQIDHETQVFESSMDWIHHDLIARRRHLYQILQEIRLNLIPQSYYSKYISKLDDLSLKIALTKLFDDLPQKMANARPRAFGRKRIFVIGGYNREIGQRWSESCTLNTNSVFEVVNDRWTSLPTMHVARSGHGAAVLDGKIYVVGGESDDSMIFSHGEVFDPIEERWEMLPNMVRPRTLHGVCAVEGLVFALGGWIGSSLGNTIESYDPDTQKWTENGVFETPRCAAGVAVHDGLIYVVGGLSESLTEVDSFESYNPITQDWKKLSKMCTNRAYVGVAVHDGCLYAVGGAGCAEKGVNSVERYLFDEGRWEEVEGMRRARVSPCVAGVGECVYVMGGRTSSDEFSPATTVCEVECFDPKVGRWRDVGVMERSCCEAAVVVM